MKKSYYFIFYALTIGSIIISSCSEKFEITETNISKKKYSVSLDEINKYILLRGNPITKSDVKLEAICNANDTLLYVVNYGNKWEIITGDKRCSPILAQGEGSFNLQLLNPNQANWLASEAEIIEDLKNMSSESEHWNTNASWNMLNQPPTLTKDGDYEFKEEDEWELVEIIETDVISETSGHLIQTGWHQYYPWNECAPLVVNSTEKCPNGCVSVAGAQMIYYLHNKDGILPTFYTEGTCTGNSDNHSFSFSNSQVSAWNNMAKSEFEANKSCSQSAILIGWMADLVDTEFSQNGSRGDIDLLGNVFRTYGYDTSYEDYSHETAFYQALSGMPSIVTAYSNKTNQLIGLIYEYSGGHCWIIDGYTKVTRQFNYVYEWTSRTENDEFAYGERIYIPHEEIEMYVLMNWGWGNTDNALYSSNSYWKVGTYPLYQYGKKLLSLYRN